MLGDIHLVGGDKVDIDKPGNGSHTKWGPLDSIFSFPLLEVVETITDSEITREGLETEDLKQKGKIEPKQGERDGYQMEDQAN